MTLLIASFSFIHKFPLVEKKRVLFLIHGSGETAHTTSCSFVHTARFCLLTTCTLKYQILQKFWSKSFYYIFTKESRRYRYFTTGIFKIKTRKHREKCYFDVMSNTYVLLCSKHRTQCFTREPYLHKLVYSTTPAQAYIYVMLYYVS